MIAPLGRANRKPVARGTPLTPEQIETAAAEYARTGSYQAAADAIGSDKSNVRRRLIAAGEPHRATAHARACERGIREARRQVADVAKMLHRVLAVENAAGVGLEPKDLASLANSLARLTDARIAIADREDRRRTARLTRAKTKAETLALSENDEAESGDINIYFAPPPEEASDVAVPVEPHS